MTKFQVGTILTSQVMDCQVHAIGKAIRSLYPVTYTQNLPIQLYALLEL